MKQSDSSKLLWNMKLSVIFLLFFSTVQALIQTITEEKNTSTMAWSHALKQPRVKTPSIPKLYKGSEIVLELHSIAVIQIISL